jgi:hypothetical protein
LSFVAIGVVGIVAAVSHRLPTTSAIADLHNFPNLSTVGALFGQFKIELKKEKKRTKESKDLCMYNYMKANEQQMSSKRVANSN